MMEEIIIREAVADDAEAMISFLNIAGENLIISCMEQTVSRFRSKA